MTVLRFRHRLTGRTVVVKDSALNFRRVTVLDTETGERETIAARTLDNDYRQLNIAPKLTPAPRA